MKRIYSIKFLVIIFFIFLTIISYSFAEDKVTIRHENFHFRFQIPSSWKEVKMETDIYSGIILKMFAPTSKSLLVITAEKIAIAIPPEKLLTVVLEAFSEDKTLTITAKGIGTFGKNKVVNIRVRGKGTGITLDKGNIDTVRHIYFIPNGNDIIQFILTAPLEEYTNVNKMVREVLNTLVFEEVKLVEAPKPEEKPVQPQPVTKPEVPVVKPEMKELAPSDILALKQNISNLGFILLFPQGKSFADFALLLPSNDFKASFVKIIVPQVIKSTDGSEQIIWLIPRNLVDTEITDLLMIMLPDQKVEGLVPLKLIKPYLDPYNDQFLQLLADKKVEEGITIKEYISKNSIIKF
jgi:hypothetical protein